MLKTQCFSAPRLSELVSQTQFSERMRLISLVCYLRRPQSEASFRLCVCGCVCVCVCVCTKMCQTGIFIRGSALWILTVHSFVSHYYYCLFFFLTVPPCSHHQHFRLNRHNLLLEWMHTHRQEHTNTHTRMGVRTINQKKKGKSLHGGCVTP